MKNLVLIIVCVLSLNASGQGKKAFFSFCEKSHEAAMTWDEFSSCKKELVSLEKSLKITSFMVSISAGEGKEQASAAHKMTGNTMSAEVIRQIEQLHLENKPGIKILIAEVMVAGDSGNERKVPGMTIMIK